MKISFNAESMYSLAWCLVAVYAVMLLPTDAMAQYGSYGSGGGTIGDLLCRVAGWFTGPVGQGLATLAIIVIGIGALMGKVSWGMAIIVGIGVAVIFGAPTIVGELSDGPGGCG